MNKVQVQLLVKFQSDEDNFYLKFSPDWSFTIAGFQFTFLNENQVKVSFEYEAELSEKEADGQVVHRIPSEGDSEFEEKREELEKVLDLISLSTGHGIKIQTGSATVSSQGIGSSNPVDNTKVVVVPDVKGITKRLEYIKRRNERGLFNGLRAYRMSLFYEYAEEKIAKLWSVVEQLYSKREGRLFTGEEYQVLKKFLEDWKELPQKKREILLKRIQDTPEISPMDSMVEKVKLMNEDGNLASDQVRDILKEWRSKRSSTAHGGRSSNREELDDVLWDIEATVETLIGSQVYPKMIRYLVFRESNIKEEFLKRQGYRVSKLDNGYCALAIKHDDFDHYCRFLPFELNSDTAYVYFVSHNKIHKLTQKEVKEINPDEVDESAQKIVIKVQEKINSA